jgi:hypothetical protein
MKSELPPSPSERKEKLETVEQIRTCIQGILSAARSEEEAKEKIRSALDGQSFMYMGPMMSWESGAMGALIDRFQNLPKEKRKALAKHMLEMLDASEDEKVSLEEVLQKAPPLSETGVDTIDMSDELETRSALVTVLFRGAKENVTVDCMVRIKPDAN